MIINSFIEMSFSLQKQSTVQYLVSSEFVLFLCASFFEQVHGIHDFEVWLTNNYINNIQEDHPLIIIQASKLAVQIIASQESLDLANILEILNVIADNIHRQQPSVAYEMIDVFQLLIDTSAQYLKNELLNPIKKVINYL